MIVKRILSLLTIVNTIPVITPIYIKNYYTANASIVPSKSFEMTTGPIVSVDEFAIPQNTPITYAYVRLDLK